MPIPKRAARRNKAAPDRIVRHAAPRAPGLALVVHRGRRPGRTYQTPVNVPGTGDGLIMALTHRPDTDRVKNIQAARGRVLRAGSPAVCHDQARRGTRPVERQAPRLTSVAGFLPVKTAR